MVSARTKPVLGPPRFLNILAHPDPTLLPARPDLSELGLAVELSYKVLKLKRPELTEETMYTH